MKIREIRLINKTRYKFWPLLPARFRYCGSGRNGGSDSFLVAFYDKESKKINFETGKDGEHVGYSINPKLFSTLTNPRYFNKNEGVYFSGGSKTWSSKQAGLADLLD